MREGVGGDVLLTGAAGFIGGRLWPALDAAGLRVRCVSRDAGRAALRWPERAWMEADLDDSAALERVLDGCRVAYYLVHGMAEQRRDFRAGEVALARKFSNAAARAGVKRIVYLGGVAPQGPPSEHLRSRLEVGAALRAGQVPTIELRAGMIVGAGSASWLIVRDLAARLPAMILPRWMRTRSQPVAADDVIEALVGAARVPLPASAWYDLPGPDVLSGKEILERAATALGLRRPLMVDVPFLSPALSSHWVRLVTRANWPVARELVLGLTHDLLARDDRYWRLIGHEQLVRFEEAARRALEEDPGGRMNGLEQLLEQSVARLAKSGRGAAAAGTRRREPTRQATEAGRLGSIQVIELPPNDASFERWGRPETLRQLLEAYFRLAQRMSGGLIKIQWSADSPTVALCWPRLPLIEMGAPTVELEAESRTIAVPVAGGMLVAPRTSARLSITMTRRPASVRLSVELTGYEPRAGRVWPLSLLHRLQSALHTQVGRRFLSSFARRWDQ